MIQGLAELVERVPRRWGGEQLRWPANSIIQSEPPSSRD